MQHIYFISFRTHLSLILFRHFSYYWTIQSFYIWFSLPQLLNQKIKPKLSLTNWPKEGQLYPIHMKGSSFWLLFEQWYFWKPLTTLQVEDTVWSTAESSVLCWSLGQWTTSWHWSRSSSWRRNVIVAVRAGVTCSCWRAFIWSSHKSHPLKPSSLPLEQQGLIQSLILPSVNTTESAAFLHVFSFI